MPLDYCMDLYTAKVLDGLLYMRADSMLDTAASLDYSCLSSDLGARLSSEPLLSNVRFFLNF